LKKSTGSVRFWIFKPGTGKTEPNRPEPEPKKPEKIEPNRFEPVFSLKNRTETGRFEPVSVFKKKKKNSVWLFFFIKTEPNRTVNTPTNNNDYETLLGFEVLASFSLYMSITLTPAVPYMLTKFTGYLLDHEISRSMHKLVRTPM